MKYLSIILFLLLHVCLLNAQLHDNTWMIGYDNNADTTDKFGIVEIKFSQGNFYMRQNNMIDMSMNETNTSFSDSLGNLLFQSNGYHIYNGSDEIMMNGEAIVDGTEGGQVVSQYVVSVPKPNLSNRHIFLYLEYDYNSVLSVHCTGLYFAEIDMAANQGLGAVISRRNIVLEDTLRVGHLVPIKHANGRDWWLLINELETNRYYRLLIDPSGVHIVGNQAIGLPVRNGVGQSVFSPNGQYFCSYNSISEQVGAYLDIYKFDRCTGLLSDHIQNAGERRRGGVSISPNSRYLYQNQSIRAFQYDLTAPDILSTKTQVVEWDSTYAPFATTFYFMKLAPDGKIYSNGVCGCNILHVIHNPDEAGLACNYEQHAIYLPTYNAFSIPNHPNFRLGPLDGSACDTLGINNLPVSWWRYDRDTLNTLSTAFTDLSYYEPATWHWDFGDGTTSTDRYREHTYATEGIYQVCLTVSNTYGSNTLCRTLHLGVSSSSDEVVQEKKIALVPNPAQDKIQLLGVDVNIMESPRFRLINSTGQLVMDVAVIVDNPGFDIARLPDGLYYWQILSNGQVKARQKLVILH